ERLPDIIVEAGAADFLDENVVGQPQNVELVAGDRARAADGETGARKWMAADKGLGQAELAAERAHLVLEQFAQRLGQPPVHSLRQTAGTVVGFCRYRRPA